MKNRWCISVNQLTVHYDKKAVLWNLHVDLPVGVLIALVGPNGAGKSTFLKALLGVVAPLSGSVYLLGKPVKKALCDVAYVPQFESVDWDFPMTVFELVLMGCYRKRPFAFWSTADEKKRVLWALDRVDLLPFKEHQIDQLSGGQKQRLFLARALVHPASLYLLDEPFAGIDATSTQMILTILKELVAEGRSVLVVHHDLEEVKKHFDWTVLLNRSVIAAGPTNQVMTPEMLQRAYGQNRDLFDQALCLATEKRGGWEMP